MKRLTAEQVIEQFRNCATAGGIVESCFLDAADIVERNLIESPDERRERFERWMWHYAITHRDGGRIRELSPKKLAKAKATMFTRGGGGEYETYGIEDMWACFNAALDFGGGGVE